jgi:hypothetical protein
MATLDPDHVGPWVDELLRQVRPDRYDAGDCEWRDVVYQKVAELIPPEEAVAVAAKQFVDSREGRATQTANARLRWMGINRAWPVDWDDDLDGHHPISVGSKRITLRAAIPTDLFDWAIEERRRAGRDFAARTWACEGAEWAAEQMVQRKWKTLAEAIKKGARP